MTTVAPARPTVPSALVQRGPAPVRAHPDVVLGVIGVGVLAVLGL